MILRGVDVYERLVGLVDNRSIDRFLLRIHKVRDDPSLKDLFAESLKKGWPFREQPGGHDGLDHLARVLTTARPIVLGSPEAALLCLLLLNQSHFDYAEFVDEAPLLGVLVEHCEKIGPFVLAPLILHLLQLSWPRCQTAKHGMYVAAASTAAGLLATQLSGAYKRSRVAAKPLHPDLKTGTRLTAHSFERLRRSHGSWRRLLRRVPHLQPD